VGSGSRRCCSCSRRSRVWGSSRAYVGPGGYRGPGQTRWWRRSGPTSRLGTLDERGLPGFGGWLRHLGSSGSCRPGEMAEERPSHGVAAGGPGGRFGENLHPGARRTSQITKRPPAAAHASSWPPCRSQWRRWSCCATWGRCPGTSLAATTVWRKGMRLLVYGSNRPITAAEFDSAGGMITVVPDGYQDNQEELAKATAIIIKMEPGPASEPDQPELDGRQNIVAYSKICTHVGCPAALYESTTHRILCPCHQSTFDATRGALGHLRAGAEAAAAASHHHPTPRATCGPERLPRTSSGPELLGAGMTNNNGRLQIPKLLREPGRRTRRPAARRPRASGPCCGRSSRTTGRSCWARSRSYFVHQS